MKHTKRCQGQKAHFITVPVVEAPLPHGTTTIAREMHYQTCGTCGSCLPLGLSDEKAVAVEVRAAELSVLVTFTVESADAVACRRFSAAEYAGWVSGRAGHAPFVDDLAEYAGYLARIIYDHKTVPAALKFVCQFCGKMCVKDDVCAGCKGVICDECDTGEAPWGFDHEPEDHLAEKSRSRR